MGGILGLGRGLWLGCRLGNILEDAVSELLREQGFDDMDEHIVRDLLRIPLDSRTAKDLENTIRMCGEKIVGLIRFEQIPPQSEMAFHVFAHACKVMFRIGAAIQLKRMGYNFEKVNLGN